MKEKIKIGLIGLGNRGFSIFRDTLLPMKDVEIIGVCDSYEDRCLKVADMYEKERSQRPVITTDYHEILKLDIDAVVITAAWEAHIQIAIDAMKAGIYVGTEVAGAYSIEDCWRLVYTSEQTGTPCMMLENCCYGKRELMLLNMVRQGKMGEIVHCDGGYHHDLRDEITTGNEKRHYRLRNYIGRNCENYPTHELVPIGKLLDINNGNRMMTLTAMASCSKGLHEYVVNKKGADDELAKIDFLQGDVVNTTIKCSRGETISLTLDTCLPRYYNRGLIVHGTKALYTEWNDTFFEDGVHNEKYEWDAKGIWGNMSEYEQEFMHPLWVNFVPVGGHGGMDELVYSAFVECVKMGIQPPIDVYDTASYMAITPLTEQSIALGGAPVSIPDFTNGKFLSRNSAPDFKYKLDK